MKLTPREIDAIVKHVKAMACRGGWNWAMPTSYVSRYIRAAIKQVGKNAKR